MTPYRSALFVLALLVMLIVLTLPALVGNTGPTPTYRKHGIAAS